MILFSARTAHLTRKCALYNNVVTASHLVKALSPLATLDRKLFDPFFDKRFRGANVSESPCSRQVFLSHTGQDTFAAVFAELLAEVLQDKHGIDVFLDSRSLMPADPWQQVIDSNARECKVFVCVISESYFKRFWCMHELDIALQSERSIVPVYYNSSIPSADDSFRKEMQSLLERKVGIVDPATLDRWCDNLLKLKSIQGVYNHSTHKHNMVSFRTAVASAVCKCFE